MQIKMLIVTALIALALFIPTTAHATASRVYHTHQTWVCFWTTPGGVQYLRVDYHDPYGNTYKVDWYFWGIPCS